MQLNSIQKQQIKELMRQPGWDALIAFTGQMIDKIKEEDIKAVTEFETLWRVAQREAKSQVLLDYFNILDQEVLN